MSSSEFAAAVQELADSPVTDTVAADFLSRWPMESVFRELSDPNVAATNILAACLALAKLFDTAPGAAVLPSTLPFASAALQSPVATLRRLAAQQLGRLLADAGGEAATREAALELLLRALQDEEVGVAAAAEAGLKQLGRPAGGGAPLHALLGGATPAGQLLRQLAASADPLLRMRSLTLLVALAGQAPAAAAAVRASGLLEPLLSELQDPDDLLSCMAALQLVRDAAEQCDAGMAAALAAAVMPRLGALLRHPEPLLQSGALRAAAALLGTALEAGEGPMEVDGAANGPANGVAGGGAAAGGDDGGLAVAPLLGALKAVLDVGSRQEFPAELEDSALDAVGILGLHASGAEALLAAPSSVVPDVAYKALGRPASPAQRVAALHALASVAGAERSGRGGKLLPPLAEDALRVAVFEGAAAAGAGETPADVLLQQLDQPFAEQRVAVYRCLAALAARDWLAGAVCSHPGLLARLLDPQSETGKQGCEWRHACVSALAATIADVMGGGLGAGGPHAAALAAAAERVQAAVRAGPYGTAAGPAEPVVASMPGA